MSGKVTIYHNPRCTKSRQTLQLIRDAGVEPEIVEYLKSPPTTAEVDSILKKLKLEPLEAMRRKEVVYSELGLNGDTPREDAIRAMAENPILLERPIVVRGRKAIIGRPPENVNNLLG
jgi:arsenate reductase